MVKNLDIRKIFICISIVLFTVISLSMLLLEETFAVDQGGEVTIVKKNTPRASGYFYLNFNGENIRIDVWWASTPSTSDEVSANPRDVYFSVAGNSQGVVGNGSVGHTFLDKNGVYRRIYIPLYYTGDLSHKGLKDGATYKNLGADEGGTAASQFETSSALNIREVSGNSDTGTKSSRAPHNWSGYFNIQINVNQCGLCPGRNNSNTKNQKYSRVVGTTKCVSTYTCSEGYRYNYYDASTSSSANKSGITSWHSRGYRSYCSSGYLLSDNFQGCDHQVITYNHSTYNVTLDKNDGTTITKSYTSQGKWTFNGNWMQSGNDWYASYTNNGEQSLTVDFGTIEQTGYTYGGIWSEDDDKGSANTIDASTGIVVI